jgi:hypothetical protein
MEPYPEFNSDKSIGKLLDYHMEMLICICYIKGQGYTFTDKRTEFETIEQFSLWVSDLRKHNSDFKWATCMNSNGDIISKVNINQEIQVTGLVNA